VAEAPSLDGIPRPHRHDLTNERTPAMPEKLNRESIRGWLNARTGWKRKSNALVKEFRFSSFRDSIVFVNRVATLADDADHHPDIDIRYDRVTLTLSTHSAGGITEKDLKLAEQVDFSTSAN
jgi:4a-hydroxytetrahydrobiopterin dehydratase